MEINNDEKVIENIKNELVKYSPKTKAYPLPASVHPLSILKRTDLSHQRVNIAASCCMPNSPASTEVVDDRSGSRSIMVAAQLPVASWHGLFADPTIADAVMDRLLHRAVRFELQGPSKRREAEYATVRLTKKVSSDSVF